MVPRFWPLAADDGREAVVRPRRPSPGGSRTAPSIPEIPLGSFLESSPDPYIGFEPSGRIVVVNRPAEELLDHRAPDLVGRSIELVLPGLSLEARPAADDTSDFAVPLFGLRVDLEARRRDGSGVPVALSLASVEAGGGRLILARLDGLSAASRQDPSRPRRRRQAGNADGQAALEKDEFLAMLAHELRTPLHSMLGWTQLLRSSPREPDLTERALEAIERNIRWQAQVIDDLIDLAEILSGQLRLEPHPVRLATVARAALERVAETARSKRIRLVETLADEETEVLADPDRLEDVLWKLLSNAIRFTSEGGRIEVLSRETDSAAQVTVSDSGQKIEPVPAASVYQADAYSRRHEGGLGLSIVRSLVEMQGGSLYDESAGPGLGSRFTISLPLSRAK